VFYPDCRSFLGIVKVGHSVTEEDMHTMPSAKQNVNRFVKPPVALGAVAQHFAMRGEVQEWRVLTVQHE
jgi:hypothetical protein